MGALLTYRLEGGEAPVLRAATGPAAVGGDPFDAGMWPGHRQEYLGEGAWFNDPAVVVLAPSAAEDSAHVPFLIDATAVAGGLPASAPEGQGAATPATVARLPVARLVVTIDYSPFARALCFYPGRALPLLGFGVKYEIAGPLRASALTGDGVWHVGAAHVDALGGGCSAPAEAHARPDWQRGFGEIRGRLWPQTGRLRLRFTHPQDTGLAGGIPAHHLSALRLLDAQGAEIARLELYEPVEENPTFTFLLPADLAAGPVLVEAQDNMGNRFAARLEARP